MCSLFSAASLLIAAEAHATASRVQEATFTSVANGWERVERWRDDGSAFSVDPYLSDGRNDQTDQRATMFGTARPSSNKFLLYHAPGWSTGSVATPVLLVHGANDNADRAWANPSINECGSSSCPNSGLMQYLSSRGYRVFAINFPHKQGDNYHWAEQIYDAVELIRARTGAAKVDIVAHSKGAFAARMYVSSLTKTGGTAYTGNVRRLVLVGGANKGIDYTFRHGYLPSIGAFSACGIRANAPTPHTDLVCYGWWYYQPELAIYGNGSTNYFPGQSQMLAKWNGVYSIVSTDQDYYTTWYGGQGYYSYGAGIDHAGAMGRSLVATLRSRGVPSSIATHLLCGQANDIPNIHNEHAGPSDGVVFSASCSDTGGIGWVAGNTVYTDLNHMKLVWSSTSMGKIAGWLSAP